ncbi:MAG TPA: helix-turn-helix domain-containing protein [Dehalococcoidia bacterium]|nr:helix-turn-helix domain-containing protein [Dehalococcoidia bacterium]
MQVEQPAWETPSTRFIEGVVELLVNQVALLDCLPQQHELKHQFIHRLLHGDNSSEEDLLREGQILGMDLSRPRAFLLIDASATLRSREDATADGWQDNSVRDWLQAQTLIRQVVRFFSLPSDAICAYLGQGEIAVLKASSSQDLDPWVTRKQAPGETPSSWSNLGAVKNAAAQLLDTLQRDSKAPVLLGIGRYHPGIRGLMRSYEDARAALSIGRKLSREGRLFCLDELGLAALVGITDQETRVDLARHLLGPLEAESELLKTLQTFFSDNCSIIAAASHLYIHRNTLNYRLEKISALIGLDPRKFDEASLIRYALIICQLSEDAPLCE